MNRRPSSSSLFLLEILLNILLFALLLTVCLQFYKKTFTISRDNERLEQAIVACNNVAAIYESDNGSLTSLQEAYPGSNYTGSNLLIYYDKSYQPCQKDEAIYYIQVNPLDSPSAFHQVAISFSTRETDPDLIYSLTATVYSQNTLGGESHE